MANKPLQSIKFPGLSDTYIVPQIDDTLSVEGRAADAKAAGNEITQLKSAIDNNGMPYEYNYTGATYRQIDMEFSANTPIYLRCLGGTAQGARFNFIKADNTRINLAELAQGEERVIIPTESYKGFRLTPLPYDGTTEKSVTAYVNQSEYSICEKIYNIARQMGYAFQPEIDGIIGASNYSEYITDANEASLNRTFIISSNITEAMVANLPTYGNYALLATITGEKTHNISLQLYARIATNVSVWFRTSVLSGSSVAWSDWKKLLKEEDITDLLYDAVARGDYSSTSSGANTVFSYDVSGGDHYRLYVWDIKNAADGYPDFRMHNVGGGYTNLADIDQIVDGTHYWDVIIPATGYDYVRLYMQKATNAGSVSCKYSFIKVEGSIIDTMQSQIDNVPETVSSHATNVRTCKIFKKVVCCGDSYTSGHIQLDGESASATNEEFAWPHFMSTLTGNEWVNCGRSGATTVTWQTDPRGLPAAQTAGHAQAYVVALMINDQKASDGVPLGTSEDIGSENPTTYYGCMSKIIRELNAISPLAKIFVCTCPMTNGNFPSYNEAVRTIVNAYKNTYPVYCLDLNASRELYKNASLVNDAINGHYTAIGYEQFSEIMAYIMSDYINNHISDFQNVHQIPYTGHE